LARFQNQNQGYRTAPTVRGTVRTIRRPRSVSRRNWTLALAAAVGSLTFLGLTDFGRDTRDDTSLSRTITEIASQFGVVLEEVSITGYKFTRLDDIFAALELEDVRTVWQADVAAIKGRIEALPWIAEATVVRVGLVGLNVDLVERRPAAIWSATTSPGASSVLIDPTGRQLGPILATAQTDLLRISGVGAAEKFPDLMLLFTQYPELKSAVLRAEFLSQRRWSLWLTSGHVLHLPHDVASAALAQISQTFANAGGADLVAKEPVELDFSVAGRVAVRRVPKPIGNDAVTLQLGNGS
jgi:cell division protein FtsQ